VVAMLEPQADAGAVIQPQAPALRLALRDLEALGAPDALHPLGVHVPARHLQKTGDALVAVAPEGARQTYDGRRERVLVVAQRQLVALRGTVLTKRPADPPF